MKLATVLVNFLRSPNAGYIALLLTLVGGVHIFDPLPAKHQLGQIEIITAFGFISAYLWYAQADVYDITKLGKKRLESVACIVGGIFSAFLFFPPLMTWQYVTLYRSAPVNVKPSLFRPAIVAVIAAWVGTALFFGGAAKHTMDKLAAQQQAGGLPVSSMPSPAQQ